MMQAGTAEVPKVTLYSYFRSSCAWRVRLGLLLKGMSCNLWLHFNISLGRIQDGILWVAMCQGPAETPFRYAKSLRECSCNPANIIFIGHAGIPYEYKAINILKGEQFTEGKNFDLCFWSYCRQGHWLWSHNIFQYFLENFTGERLTESYFPKCIWIKPHISCTWTSGHLYICSKCMQNIGILDSTDCHWIDCRVYQAEPNAAGSSIGDWWCKAGRFSCNSTGFSLHTWHLRLDCLRNRPRDWYLQLLWQLAIWFEELTSFVLNPNWDIHILTEYTFLQGSLACAAINFFQKILLCGAVLWRMWGGECLAVFGGEVSWQKASSA